MLLVDFRGAGQDVAIAAWRPVGDPVMGGRSLGSLRAGGDCAVFEGCVSLARGGGFASVRTDWSRRDLAAFEGLAVHVRGDDKTFKLLVRDAPGFDTVLHRVTFVPASTWRTVRFPFAAFRPTVHGREIGSAPLRPDRIVGCGLMISDRQAGPFRLEIAWIAAYVRETASGASPM